MKQMFSKNYCSNFVKFQPILMLFGHFSKFNDCFISKTSFEKSFKTNSYIKTCVLQVKMEQPYFLLFGVASSERNTNHFFIECIPEGNVLNSSWSIVVDVFLNLRLLKGSSWIKQKRKWNQFFKLVGQGSGRQR